MNYHNEFDPHAAEWLRGLMTAALIPTGVVDERSITDVRSADIRDFVQCHFFAGIGGWCEALRLAGWPADRPVWSASLPCTPFSSAGKRKGKEDERHLWPVFFGLVRECRPPVLIGEQVASAGVVGRASKVGGFDERHRSQVEGEVQQTWLDGIQRDLEGEGYTVGHCVLGAHSVGSPHIRQRLYWVAHTDGGLGDSDIEGREGRGLSRRGRADQRAVGTAGDEADGFWSDYDVIPCSDGKSRRIESGLPALVTGLPFLLADGRTRKDVSRTKVLRGIGNAIVPQVAAEFIKSFMETQSCDGMTTSPSVAS